MSSNDFYDPLEDPAYDNELNKRVCESRALYSAEMWKAILRSYEGRAVLHQIIAGTGFPDTPYNENPYLMAFQNGKHSVGNEITKNVLTLAPEVLTMMKDEAEDRERKFLAAGQQKMEDEGY